MNKYYNYGREALRVGGISFFLTSLNFYIFKKAPKEDILVDNPVMGKYKCRKGTIDFIFSFFNYEYKIKKEILSRINEFDTFIDIGACIGDYSIWLTKNNIRSIAFEPNTDNFQALQENISLNNLEDKITVLNYGLGEKNETIFFKSHPENKGYSGKYVDLPNATEHQVDIKIFDEIFVELGLDYSQHIIIKIDAEGMEAEIIGGATQFLKNIRKALIIFESHTGEDLILQNLSKITKYKLIAIDNLNKGVLIENINP